jgi:hypothetical protein
VLGDALGPTLGPALGEALGTALGEAISTGDELGASLGAASPSIIGDRLGEELGEPLGEPLGDDESRFARGPRKSSTAVALLLLYCLPTNSICQSFSFVSFLLRTQGLGGFTMSSESTGKFQTPDALYAAFVKAVILDVASALRLVHEAAFPDGVDSPPSPRVEVLIETGEWEADLVAMVPCTDDMDMCKAKVVVRSLGNEPCAEDRFCFARNCLIISHQDPETTWELQEGWYVRGGLREIQGAHASTYLPSKAVSTAVALTFTRKNLPLKMSLGMWKLLCEDYAAGEAAELSLSKEEEPYPYPATWTQWIWVACRPKRRPWHP